MATKKPDYPGRTLIKIIGLICALIVGSVILTIWYFSFGFEIPIYRTPEFRAMNKAASKIQITSGKIIEKYQNDFSYALGMPSYAKIMILYQPKSGYSKQDVYQDIISDLENYGFQLEDINTYNTFTSYSATYSLSKFHVKVLVIDSNDKDYINVHFSTAPPPSLNPPTTPKSKLQIINLQEIQN